MKAIKIDIPDNLHAKVQKFATKENKTIKQVLFETVASRSDIFTKRDIKELVKLGLPKSRGRGDVKKTQKAA